MKRISTFFIAAFFATVAMADDNHSRTVVSFLSGQTASFANVNTGVSGVSQFAYKVSGQVDLNDMEPVADWFNALAAGNFTNSTQPLLFKQSWHKVNAQVSMSQAWPAVLSFPGSDDVLAGNGRTDVAFESFVKPTGAFNLIKDAEDKAHSMINMGISIVGTSTSGVTSISRIDFTTKDPNSVPAVQAISVSMPPSAASDFLTWFAAGPTTSDNSRSVSVFYVDQNSGAAMILNLGKMRPVSVSQNVEGTPVVRVALAPYPGLPLSISVSH